MKTRILAVMLVICMLLSLAPAASAEESSAITWTVVDGVMTISGTGPMWPEDETPPFTWPDGAGITAVVVEEGITEVSRYAFEDFAELTSVTLADTVDTVGSSAFSGCTALTSVTLPDSVKTVGYGAFSGCTALTDVTMAYGIHVNKDAFTDTLWLETLPRDEKGFAVHQGILLRYEGEETSIEIPEGVVSIGGDFSETELSSVLLPEGVVNVGDYAFYHQYNLAQVNFPDSLNRIGDYAFEDTALTTAMLPETLDYLGDGAFDYCHQLTTASVPGGVSYLGDSVFLQCITLTNVTLGEGIDDIPEDMFSWCRSLPSVELPGTITCIGEEAFAHCYSLTEIVIPQGVTSIGYAAFWDCYSLTEIVIPEGVTSISSSAFSGCYWMTSAVLPETLEILDGNAFDGCTSLEELNIPDSVQFLSSSGLEDTPWMEEQYDENGFAIVGPWLLSYRGSDTALVIPDSVERIAGYALNVCESKESITSLTLPQGLEYIGYRAFEYCSGLTELNIPDAVTFIDSGAFYACNGLTELVIPDSITAMGSAFSHCEGLTDVTLSASLTEIPAGCFSGCSSLENIEIPDSVTTIGYMAFYGCSSLENIEIPDSVTTIGYEAFYGCSSLENIEIPDSVTTIGYMAFYGCTSMDSITIPAGVTVIEDKALGYYMDDYWYSSELIRYFTIYGYTGTAAEVYAKENGIDFVALDAPQPHVHDYIGEVTEPTCTEQGYTTYICDCGDSFVGEYVAALGHEYENGACIRCGASLENPFTDVPAGSFYEEPVLWAVENNITNGLSATEFGPNATCNRAQVVTFLWRAAGCPEPASSNNPFVDVQSGSFYEAPVLWAVEMGITNGSDASHFNPGGVCNRAQVVTFLYRAFESPDVSAEGLPFTDVPAGAWYEAPIAWAVANGITNGISATEFGPNASCNRAQVVTFLYRAYQG